MAQKQTFYDNLLQSDWLGRNAEDYTYKKGGHSIGWEQTLLKDEPLSRFILKVKNPNLPVDRKIFLTKQACTNILTRMVVKDVNKIKITFVDEFLSSQRGNSIQVTLEPIGDKFKFPTFNHRLDPVLGYCVHEIAHYLYTDASYDRYLNRFKGVEQEIKKTIMNVLEDERIEQLVAVTYRGYTGYLGKAKDYCFGLRLPEEMKMNRVDLTEELNQLGQTFLLLLRYPKALDPSLVNKFEPQLKKIMDILTPYPDTIQEMTVATDKIYKIFEAYFSQQQQQQGQGGGNQQQQPQQSQKNQPQGGGSDTGGDDGDDGEEDVELTPGEKAELAKVLGAFMQAVGSAMPHAGATAEEVAKVLNDAKKGEYQVAQVLKDISEYTNDEIGVRTGFAHVYPENENISTTELSVHFQDAKDMKGTQNHYDKALDEVRTYASMLRAKLQQLNRNQTITNSGLFEGDFDDALLVDAIIGAKNVYKLDSKIMNRGAVIALLIDESGSMGGRGQSKWFEAMKIAVLFERALEGVNNIDFYCYGHTTGTSDKRGGKSDATWINVYYEGRKNSDRKILGKIHAHETNRDGHAILETVARMRTKIKMDVPIVMFMISDGEPSASVPHGYNGKSYTKKAVQVVKKYHNCEVIHIAIEKGIPSADMFEKYVTFSDHNTLVNDIGALLKKVITNQNMPIEI